MHIYTIVYMSCELLHLIPFFISGINVFNVFIAFLCLSLII